MSVLTENYLSEKYSEIFRVPIEIHRAKEDIVDYALNGFFWGTAKAAKHLLGSSNVYEIYAYTIVKDNLSPHYRKVNAAKEACGYALGKHNLDQLSRFVMYGADLEGKKEIIDEVAYRYACYHAKKHTIPESWFIVYAENACEVAFYGKANLEYREINTMVLYGCAQLFNGHDNAMFLYLLGLAYYGNPEEKRFIDDCRQKKASDSYFNEQLMKAKSMWQDKGCYYGI